MLELRYLLENVLRWQHSPTANIYTLQAGEVVLAAMHWPGSPGARAFVAAAEQRWTIYRQGVFAPQIIVQDMREQSMIALLERGSTHKGKLTLDTGEILCWLPANIWRSSWAWKGPSGTIFFRFDKQKRVQVEPCAFAHPHLTLLSVLGCFLITLQEVEARSLTPRQKLPTHKK